MSNPSNPAGRKAPERGLRRLNRALDVLLSDRASRDEGTGTLSYVDFSELFAFAFRSDPEKPGEDFLGGRDVDEATATWMLALATHHLFNGWESGPVRLLPPHRSELAAELRRMQRELRPFRMTRERIVEHFPRDLREGLAKGESKELYGRLLEVIVRGQLSALCTELLDRERQVSQVGRSHRAVRDLLDRGALMLTDDANIEDYEPDHDELVPVEDALSRARQGGGGTNLTDSRALLYLRESVTRSDAIVRFTTRSVAVKKALQDLSERSEPSAAWARVRASLRVPEAVLLDFLAGPESNGTEWLTKLRTQLEHFLAQVDRARERPGNPDHEISETTRRAWGYLVEALNLRRSTRPDVPQLLSSVEANDASAEHTLSRVAEILSTPDFQAETENRIEQLLDSIESAEWKIALSLSSVDESDDVAIPVRVSAPAAGAAVTFSAGSFEVSLRFVKEIRNLLRQINVPSVTPEKLTQILLGPNAVHGAEADLLVAAILASTNRWSDALLYCDRAIEGLGDTSDSAEARFFRGLCLRKTARAAALESESAAATALRGARTEIEAAIRWSRDKEPDARYVKELGTVALVWADLGLPGEDGWSLDDAIRTLERGCAAAKKGARNSALLRDTLNNLCYAYALSDDPEQIARGIEHVEHLEALSAKQPDRDPAVEDTILLLRARDAKLRRDLPGLETIRAKCEELVSVQAAERGGLEARRRHLSQVSAWCSEVAESLQAPQM